MQKLVKAYKDSEGDEKEKIKSRLKTLTKIKKELEMML
jgi:4-hydroxybenzoate polyprenyltransferase